MKSEHHRRAAEIGEPMPGAVEGEDELWRNVADIERRAWCAP
jgi:hypothetical protein